MALCTGLAPSVQRYQRVPPSWYAVSLLLSSEITADFLRPHHDPVLGVLSADIVTAVA